MLYVVFLSVKLVETSWKPHIHEKMVGMDVILVSKIQLEKEL